MKKIVVLGLLCCICVLSACTNLHRTPSKSPPPLGTGMASRDTKLPIIDTVVAHGPFDIEIKQIAQQSYLHVSGDNVLVDLLQYKVEDGALHLFMDDTYVYNDDYPLRIYIEVPQLNGICTGGMAKVNAPDVSSHHLVVNAGGAAKVSLCGYATRFDATFAGVSRLDAKCLYTQTAFVNTSDIAQAELASHQGVSALASGQSDIYYYDHPQLVAPYERQFGSVMRMQGLAEQAPLGEVLTQMAQNETAVMEPAFVDK